MRSFLTLFRMQHLAFALLFLCVPTLVSAATYVVPPDADLIREADAIAIVTIQSSHSYFADDGRIATDYAAIVESTLKGSPAAGAGIVLTQHGGTVGEIGMGVSGEPAFLPGERALLMMRSLASGRFTTWSGELGKFSFVRDAGSRRLLMRGATEGEIAGWDVAGRRHNERAREEAAFLRYIDAIVAGESAAADYEVEESAPLSRTIAAGQTTSCSTPSISVHPQNKTITSPATSTSLSVTATGSGPLTYQWYVGDSGDDDTPTGTNSTSITVSPVATTNYWVRVTGQCPPVANSNTATVTVIVGPCAPPQISSFSDDRTITKGTGTQLTVTATGTAPLHYQWYIGAPGNTAQPTGNDNKNLIVSPTTTTSYWVRVSGACAPTADSGAILVTVVECPAVIIGAPTATPNGSNMILSIEGTSTAVGSLSYAWFLGNTPGVGGVQVGGTKSISVAVTTEVKNYWVRVSNTCNRSVVSSLVPVGICTPNIATQPADQTIQSGASATLSLALTGDSTGATVTWYRGHAPDKTNPVGTGNSVNTGPLTATTSYWAAVRKDNCEVSTRTAVITVCNAPVVTTQPASQEVKKNTSVTLTVVATGTAALQYQWYQGTKGDTSNPVPGATFPTFTSEMLFQPTSFWVRVTNTCGTVDSDAAQIDVTNGRRRAVRK